MIPLKATAQQETNEGRVFESEVVEFKQKKKQIE